MILPNPYIGGWMPVLIAGLTVEELIYVLRAKSGEFIGGMRDAEKGAEKSSKGILATMASLRTGIGLVWTFIAERILEGTGKAIYGMAQMAAKSQDLRAAFYNLSVSAGQSAQDILNAMRKGALGTVSDLNLIRSANRALLSELPATAEQFEILAQGARVLGKARGMGTAEAFDILIAGISRGAPRALDQLLAGSAKYELMAQKLEKSTDATAIKTEMLNRTLEILQDRTKAAKDEGMDFGDKLDVLEAKIENHKESLNKHLMPVYETALGYLDNLIRKTTEWLNIKPSSANPLQDRIDTLKKEIEALKDEGVRKIGGVPVSTNPAKEIYGQFSDLFSAVTTGEIPDASKAIAALIRAKEKDLEGLIQKQSDEQIQAEQNKARKKAEAAQKAAEVELKAQEAASKFFLDLMDEAAKDYREGQAELARKAQDRARQTTADNETLRKLLGIRAINPPLDLETLSGPAAPSKGKPMPVVGPGQGETISKEEWDRLLKTEDGSKELLRDLRDLLDVRTNRMIDHLFLTARAINQFSGGAGATKTIFAGFSPETQGLLKGVANAGMAAFTFAMSGYNLLDSLMGGASKSKPSYADIHGNLWDMSDEQIKSEIARLSAYGGAAHGGPNEGMVNAMVAQLELNKLNRQESGSYTTTSVATLSEATGHQMVASLNSVVVNTGNTVVELKTLNAMIAQGILVRGSGLGIATATDADIRSRAAGV